ncbi:MAG: amidohydrolase [Gammaproteobacteria bacterium]|nr:MAG: amidohydrolase [Gammaproteobacteria bacterium]RLA33800.1 MAG: amidohydrolase [Gammaproteobacteria bacterium]
MRILLKIVAGLVPGLLLASTAISADLVLKNGKFYTVDTTQPWAQAVAIEGGRLVYVGDADGVSKFIDADTAVHDLSGRFVLPGLVDSHTHPGLVARSVDYVDLPWTPETKQEMFDVLVAYAEANPEKDFIVGGRWPTALFGEEGPNRQELDAVIADRPVILKDTSGHAQWLNTRALEVLGIDRDTPDPIPGLSYLYRDADGEPTGWIKERAIDKQLAAAGIGGINPDSLAGFLDYLAARGVTVMFDAGNSDEGYKAAAILERENRMPLRYEGSYRIETEDQLNGAVAELKRLREAYGGERLKFNTIKIMFDGVSEIRTSAVLEPFLGEEKYRGKTLVDSNRLRDFILELHEEAIDLHLHTVGDNAVRTALDAVEAARAELGGAPKIRITLCHLEVIDDSDFDRFSELDIFSNFSPQWHGGHIQGAQLTLGQERYDKMFRAQPLIDRNVTVTFSSDITNAGKWKTDRASPFFGMQVGHTRVEPEFGPDAKIRPPENERLSVADMILGYTLNGAMQLGMESDLGSIEVGKIADLVVLDRNLFEVLPDQIKSTRPTAVLMEGRLTSGSLP